MRIENQQSKIQNRHGYTLLEVLLASAIGVLLMAALYVAMDIQLRHAQAGREVAEQSQVVRALLTRMGNDIASSLAATPPNRGGSSGNNPGAGGGANPQATGANQQANATGGNASAQPATASATASGANSVVFNQGLQGDAGRVSLYISRVPRELAWGSANTPAADSQAPVFSDLRRVTYWLAGTADNPLGLARQEVSLITSDDAINSMPPDVPDEGRYVIADEVRGLKFRYHDGSGWVDGDSWDGSQTGSDGQSVKGPPAAVEITLEVLTPGSGNPRDGERQLKTYTHVVLIPTANGQPQQSQQSTGGTGQ